MSKSEGYKVQQARKKMMNVKQFRFLYKYAQGVAIAIAMVGCSPRVTSEMTVEELLPQPTNKVMIIGAADSVPTLPGTLGMMPSQWMMKQNFKLK